MATIIDTVEEDTTDTTADNQNTDQQEDFQIPHDEPEKETQPEDDLPDKYRGKSLKEVAAMHQEAERLVGRQGDEVGQLRKVVDDYIQTEIDKREVTKEPAEEVDFFTDPDKAIESKISNHPAVKQAIEQAEKFNQASNLATLQRKYPKMETHLNDVKFQEWVDGSEYRKALFSKANTQYDLGAADEMFGMWEERLSVVDQTVNAEASSRSAQVRQASTGSSGGSRAASGRKTYRRSDIIKLMRTDPDRYQDMSSEIMKAYAEGRVK
jgi:hypothetical protein|tara:strand:+ start:143 stop:943 length:801 start_codon:yes stop_codon:yes gene_type:complete